MTGEALLCSRGPMVKSRSRSACCNHGHVCGCAPCHARSRRVWCLAVVLVQLTSRARCRDSLTPHTMCQLLVALAVAVVGPWLLTAVSANNEIAVIRFVRLSLRRILDLKRVLDFLVLHVVTHTQSWDIEHNKLDSHVHYSGVQCHVHGYVLVCVLRHIHVKHPILLWGHGTQ